MKNSVFREFLKTARSVELERVQKLLSQIRDYSNEAPLFLNFFAPKGSGKRAFLEFVWQEYEQTLPTSLVRIEKPFDEAIVDATLKRILVHIINDFVIRLPERIVSVPDNFENLDTEQLAKLLLKIIADAKVYEKLTLLLIDDFDSLPETLMSWFQVNILSPASRTENIAVILTSETELRFTKEIEIKSRLEARKLNNLDTEAISRALPNLEGVAGHIYTLTGGLLNPVTEFSEQLEKYQVTTPTEFDANAEKLAGIYYRTYVEGKYFPELAQYSDIDTLLVLTILRRFDVKVLKKLLPNVLSDIFQGYETVDYLNLLNRLQSWIVWRSEGGYALEPGFRMMVRGYVLVKRPDLFVKVSRTAELMYRDWYGSENRQRDLIELLYHALDLYKFSNGNTLNSLSNEKSTKKASAFFFKYLEKNGDLHLDNLNWEALRYSLEKDPDFKGLINWSHESNKWNPSPIAN